MSTFLLMTGIIIAVSALTWVYVKQKQQKQNLET